jgi:GAF domain-containing protein
MNSRTPANSSGRAFLGMMRGLFDASLDVSTGLDLDETFRHIVQAAVELIGAHSGRLGVLDQHGVMVTFVHVDPDPEQPYEP